MLFRIRLKLLFYFIVLVVLLTSVGLFFYKSSETVVSEYDENFQSFLLLNDISQRTNTITDKLHAYILEKEERYHEDYRKEKRKLIADQKKLYEVMKSHDVTLINFKNMIDSFLDESDATVGAFQRNNINDYSDHFNDVLNTSSFLHESTLAILNSKLTDYEKFYHQMEKQKQYYRLMSYSLFTAAFFLSTLLALWISGGITKPISMLSKAAKEISSGNLDGEDIKITTKDELKLLTETFNQMRTNLRQLVLEIKQKSELDKLLKETELRRLQHQINPHFLFNTLNTVSKLAYFEEAEQTSRLIEAVAAILRYNLGDLNQASTLRDEVRIVKEYFFIQQTRFGDRIKFKTDIQQDCLDIEVPRLILQPLVENAFIHGVESYEEDGEICLHIDRFLEWIVIEVIDNGKGMGETVKQRLLKYREENGFELNNTKSHGHSTSIGVKNVIRRLQLFYQQQAIVEIESQAGNGTTFRLKIPNGNQGGDCFVESTGC
ncbi:sensor histidine kinase [Neobacillus fumarioli]|uniref:sensor histidine kinase n=1 Tax=Neobacillus fumarioli TaxID=105229 RepID=UPI000835B876|nr:sensor histidine kinase [Neobacillus fumarioli]